MASQAALWLGILLVGVPWLVILVDALLGFDLVLGIAMMLVFGTGLIFVAAMLPAE